MMVTWQRIWKLKGAPTVQIWVNLNIKTSNGVKVGRIMTLKDAHNLIPKTFKHIRIHGKEKLRMLINDPKLGVYPGLLDGPNIKWNREAEGGQKKIWIRKKLRMIQCEKDSIHHYRHWRRKGATGHIIWIAARSCQGNCFSSRASKKEFGPNFSLWF